MAQSPFISAQSFKLGAEWTEMDIEDLKSAIEHCRSIEEIAEFLCRSESVDDCRAQMRGAWP